MQIQKLNENWQMCINGTEEFLPAAVPEAYTRICWITEGWRIPITGTMN